jgi:hypothetical protein
MAKPELTPVELEQGALRPDMNAVREYGSRHPDAWVTLKFARNESDKLMVVALFSGDEVEVHEVAPRQLVPHPDHLAVRRSRYSGSYLDRILKDIEEMCRGVHEGAFSGWGPGWDYVQVNLHADQEALAAELSNCYGDAVRLRVGHMNYPLGQATNTESGSGRSRPSREPISIPNIEVRLELTPSHVAVGENGRGRVVLHNTGSEPVDIHSGRPLVGVVLEPSTGEVVGSGTLAIAGTGWGLTLEAGMEASIDMVYGTASTRPDLGYALPPGHYLVRTEVPIHGPPPEQRIPPRVLLVPPAELTIEEGAGTRV